MIDAAGGSAEINPVALRKRSLEEVLIYFSNKYENLRIAIVYSNQAWFVMCDDGNGPIELQIKDLRNLSTDLSFVVAAVITRSKTNE